MKNLLFVAILLFAGCSKDDDNSPEPTPSEPELKMWVYSNFKYPVLKVWDDTTLTTEINNDPANRNNATPVYYERATLSSGPHLFAGTAQNYIDSLMLDADTLWVRLVVKYKGATLIDSTRTGVDLSHQVITIFHNDTI